MKENIQRRRKSARLPSSAEALRAHAIALWRRGERDAALELRKDDEQLLWELSGVLNRLGKFDEVVRLLEKRDFDEIRDDLYLELVHAENKLYAFARARELLAAHEFIPCEGGEPAVTSRCIEAMSGLWNDTTLAAWEAAKSVRDGGYFATPPSLTPTSTLPSSPAASTTMR